MPELVCGPDDMAFFIHGNHLYDFRFRVLDLEWTSGDRLNTRYAQ